MQPRSPKKRRLHRLLPYLGAATLLALIAAGLWPRPAQVETAPVTRGPLRVTIDEEGRTRVRHRYLVSAPVTGTLRRIDLKAGASVTAHQTVVATIDPLPPALLDARTRTLAEARRDSAVAQLGKASVNREFAASELRRFIQLHREGSASAQELETAQLREAAAARDLTTAESSLRQAEAELAQFDQPGRTNHPPTQLLAPANGRILRVLEESSRVVSAGTPLLEIGNPADLELVIEVLSRDGATIPPGTPVELDHWGGSQPLQAQVRLVEPAAFTKISALGVEEQRVNVIADLITPPDQRPGLGDRFRVEARIIVWQGTNITQVPSGALFRRGEAWAAFVLHNNRATLRPVQIGHAGSLNTEITSGLEPGDTVVLYPGDRVRDGQRVRTVDIRP